MLSKYNQPKQRLKVDSIIEYINNEGEIEEITAKDALYRTLNNGNNGLQDFEQIFEDYEMIYDEQRMWLLVIYRDVRLKLRKYFYCAPIYVCIPINSKTLETPFDGASLRYYQKMEPLSWLRAQPKEDAYLLGDYPYQQAYHPHIDASGTPCYGDWHRALEEIETLTGKLETIRGFLNDYNGRSTFFTVNPYAHDVKNHPERNHLYPSFNYRLVQDNNGGHGFNTLDELMSKHFGGTWYCEMAKDLGLNLELVKVSYKYFKKDYDNADSCTEYLTNVLRAIPDLCDIVPYDYPGRCPVRPEYTTSEAHEKAYAEWSNNLEEYRKYTAFINDYTHSGWSKNVFLWMYHKLGYVFNQGDFDGLIQSFNTWYFINLNHDDSYRNHLEMMRNTGSCGHRFFDLTNSMGVNPNYRIKLRELGILIVLIKNSDITNVLLNVLEFEYAKRMSNPTDSIKALHIELSNKNVHDYESLHLHRNFELNKDYKLTNFSLQPPDFDGARHGNMFKQAFMNNALPKIIESVKKLYETASETCSQEHQNLVLNIILNEDEAIRYNTNFNEYFQKVDINKDDFFIKALRMFFRDYIVADISHNDKAREWLWEKITTISNANDDINSHESYDAFNGAIYDMENEDKQETTIDTGIAIWYRMFPEFPTSVNQIKGFRSFLDKQLVIKATQYFIELAQQQEKEYRDVLKNTVSDMEQGELFPEQVPFN